MIPRNQIDYSNIGEIQRLSRAVGCSNLNRTKEPKKRLWVSLDEDISNRGKLLVEVTQGAHRPFYKHKTLTVLVATKQLSRKQIYAEINKSLDDEENWILATH